MLNKIIKELEASKGWYDKIYYHGIDHAISIIKQHESEFNHHTLSPEDIERAASKYAFENNTHRSNSKAFIAGANFAKQPHSNEVDEPIYCNCETPTLGTNLTRCGTCGEWFKRIV